MKQPMRTLMLSAILVIMLGLSSCSTSSNLYSWYNYEQVTYAYTQSQSPERLSDVVETYKKMIDRQVASRKTPPPGICAEYGYLLVRTGQKELGLQMLAKEVELYPESTVFINRIIEQLKK